jgi:hypothetical protein
MDWGLFDAKPGDNKFLREEIVYSSTVMLFLFFAAACSIKKKRLFPHTFSYAHPIKILFLKLIFLSF